MPTDRIEALNDLLVEAERAHGDYERSVLDGVYDEDWATWYAAYAVEHGIDGLLGHDVAAGELAGFLASCYVEHDRLDPAGRETWARFTSRRIAAEL